MNQDSPLVKDLLELTKELDNENFRACVKLRYDSSLKWEMMGAKEYKIVFSYMRNV